MDKLVGFLLIITGVAVMILASLLFATNLPMLYLLMFIGGGFLGAGFVKIVLE